MKNEPESRQPSKKNDRSSLISLADLAFIMLFTLLISKEHNVPGSMRPNNHNIKIKLGSLVESDLEMDQWCIRFTGNDLSHFSCIKNRSYIEFRERGRARLNEKLDSIIKTINHSQKKYKILFQCSPESDFNSFIDTYQDAKTRVLNKIRDSERVQISFGMSQ